MSITKAESSGESSSGGTTLTTEQENFLDAWTADVNLKLLSTDYTLESGTNSIKLGALHKLSAGGTVLCLQVDTKYYFLLAQEVTEGGTAKMLIISATDTKEIQTDYDTTLSSDVTASYTISGTEIVYGINLRPAEAGYLTYTMYAGTDSTGVIRYSKTIEVTDDDVGEIFTLPDPFVLEEDEDVYVEISGVALYGNSSGEPFTTASIYPITENAMATGYDDSLLINDDGTLGVDPEFITDTIATGVEAGDSLTWDDEQTIFVFDNLTDFPYTDDGETIETYHFPIYPYTTDGDLNYYAFKLGDMSTPGEYTIVYDLYFPNLDNDYISATGVFLALVDDPEVTTEYTSDRSVSSVLHGVSSIDETAGTTPLEVSITWHSDGSWVYAEVSLAGRLAGLLEYRLLGTNMAGTPSDLEGMGAVFMSYPTVGECYMTNPRYQFVAAE